MSAKSAKAKGRRIQNFMSGEDIVLSPAARKLIKYSFECKNKERLDLWKSLEQAEGNSEDRTPVLVIKRNRSKTYAVIEADHFIDLIKEENE